MNDIERLLIENACHKQIIRFARLSDLGDYEALVAMFTETATFSRPTKPDVPLVGRRAIFDAFENRPLRKSVHLVSNIIVDVKDSDNATTRSHIALFTSPLTVELAHKPYLVGHYEDELQRVDGQWLFASRIGGVDFKIE
ncbi:nuclear transport factor 2 family protein [Pseudomonas sp. App30]|uniref:nuclear transport factor 2 family protein n=1 Tax=Pseudomonas sp. App30 TaxID=3068990 RepID=UPI003A80790B